MGFYGMGSTDARRAADIQAKKDAQAKLEATDKIELTDRLMHKTWGEPLYFVDGRSANLLVYEDKIVIDRCKGGFFNLFNHGVKVIPMKEIRTIQYKNKGITIGAIEFGVAGFDSANNLANVAVNFIENENCFAFSSQESTEKALQAYMYIVGRICAK